MHFKFKATLISFTVFFMTLVSCGGSKNYGKKGEYTYHEAIKSTPSEWNPHLLKDSSANYIDGLTTQGFVEVAIGKNNKHEWRYEMAESITDITASFDQKEKFGITEDSKRVYEIKLNRNAKWENGEVINADSYIYSMKQLLNQEMMNTRAAVFTDGVASIVGAKDYFYNGKAVYTFFDGPNSEGYFVDENNYVYKNPGHEQVFYSVDVINPKLWSMSLRQLHDGDHANWFLKDGEDFFDTLANQPKNEDGYSAVTVDLYSLFVQIAVNIQGESAASLWPILCVYQSFYNGTWEDVGFYKTDDYTLIYVVTHQLSLTDLFSQLSTGFLVNEVKYEALKSKQGNLTVTAYGTSVANYLSYGPYKLISIERDKQIVLAKNEQWYGYSDGKHNNMYKTTKVVYQVINKHDTALNMFLKGQLEVLPIDVTDMAKYNSSSNLLQADEDKIFSFCFNTNLDQLKALETGAGVNKRVGVYTSFREAFSFALNRLSFVNNATAGSRAQVGLFNNQYLYDGEHTYRDSEQGMKVIVDHYGVEYGAGKEYSTLLDAYRSVTGYDLDKAKQLFQQTYTQMKADGNYTDGQQIELNCICTQYTTLSEEKLIQNRVINEFLAEATKGTGFENKIKVTFTALASESEDMDLKFHDGQVEMILACKYGAVDSPFHLISKYIVDRNDGAGNYLVPEVAAFDPRNETITLTIDGEEITKSVRWWANQINAYGGNYDNAPIETKLMILAALEQYLLDHYISIPVYSRCIAQLSSKKINQGTTVYNRYYEYGGIPYMTYNYDDYEWSKYIEASGGRLSYDD